MSNVLFNEATDLNLNDYDALVFNEWGNCWVEIGNKIEFGDTEFVIKSRDNNKNNICKTKKDISNSTGFRIDVILVYCMCLILYLSCIFYVFILGVWKGYHEFAYIYLLLC